MKKLSLFVRLIGISLFFAMIATETTLANPLSFIFPGNDKEIIDLKFTGFVFETTSEVTVDEVVGVMPTEYQNFDWEIVSLDPEDPIYQLQLRNAERNQNVSWTKSLVWEFAYEMKNNRLGQFVSFDPLFEPVDEDEVGENGRVKKVVRKLEKGDSYSGGNDGVPGGDGLLGDCSWPEEERSNYRWKGKRICYPATSDDFEWTNRFLRYKEAWKVVKNRGSDVLIGHPDSGYSVHPEIYPNFYTDMAKNFVEEGEEAADNYKGPHHGHGTSTGSLIASPYQRQGYDFTAKHIEIYGDDPDNAPYVEGMAPESRIVSYRVMKGNVIRLSFKNLTKAIKQATRDGVGVISISLGGPLPMPWLHRAIKKATKAGIIVVAAAGNFIPSIVGDKFVVWPANYKETVAVAASDPNGKPWKHSSRGRKIDISAPGTGVWVARAKDVDDNGRVTEVTRGSGTSFSTGFVAGAAALWLSHHGRDFLANKYGERNIPWLFKYILKTYGHNTPEGWNTKKYGVGILDVYKLVTAPLPEPEMFNKVNKRNQETYLSENLEQFKGLFDQSLQDRVVPTLMKLFQIKSENELNATFDRVGYEFNSLFSIKPGLVKKFTKLMKTKRFRFWWRAKLFKLHLKRKGLSKEIRRQLNYKR